MNRLLLLWLCALCLAYGSQLIKTDIVKDWKMAVADGPTPINKIKGKVFETSIPSTVHLDLQKAGEIPNPLLGENYPSVRWVSQSNFIYSTNFTVSDQAFAHTYHKLSFEGIDTYSEVFLNGKKILTTQNAFRKYSVYLGRNLKQGVNLLEVKIKSTKEFDSKGQSSQNMPFEYAHTRKACYQYSWDWAPYLNTMGIWKPVYLQSFRAVKLDYVWMRTRSITKDKAVVNVAIALQTPNLEGKQIFEEYLFQIFQDGKSVGTFTPSEQYSYHDIQVLNPKLWWPNGIGQPHIYDFQIKLLQKQGKVLVDQRTVPFGIRTVQLNLKDKKFQVVVNGYKVYCKGANWVPPDMFYARLENSIYKPANTITSLLDDAVASNFNMLRVWGGGQYESDHFLQEASRKGIMLFYDFMFSDSIYPSNEAFLLNVEEQIKQQVRRARNYPALTLWCGNNQILQGVNDWGWSRKQYKDNYHKLFEILIPKIVQYQSPYIPYIPSSPLYGVGNFGFDRGGDVHYWGVWAGSSAFESYQNSVGKFNSQFGTQALPVWQTIQEGITKTPSYQSSTLLLHERHNSRFNTLKSYMTMYMQKSLDFELQTYQSGLLQAFAIELAIKAQRVAKPDSYGTLYWQMNDAWPAISWSSIDYYGRWKPLQFMAKRLYPDVSIFVLKDKVFVVSDELYAVTALAVIKFFSLDGKLLSKVEKEINLAANQVKEIHEIKAQDYKEADMKQSMIYTEVIAGKDETMISTHFNTQFKNLKLFPAEIEVKYHPDFNAITIETKATVVKNLFISRKSKYLKLSNNYFDLVPGHPVKVLVLGSENLESMKDDLVFRSYREVYQTESKVKVNVQ